jgi:addiction module HigA family antidote
MSTKKLLEPIKPGEILREDFMDQLGISINKLSRDLSVPPNRISEIVNGKRAITADTALRLQRYFGVEAQFWLNLQTEYDLRMMKRKIWTDIERRIIPIKTSETKYAAYKEMAADQVRESEALEWAEGSIGDVNDEES